MKVRYEYDQSYEFTSDWFSSNIPVWMNILNCLAGKPDIQYLEIGTYEGRSLFWVLENILTHPSSRAFVIDPFLDDKKLKRYRDNLRKFNKDGKVSTIIGKSQDELTKLPTCSFDLIYVDGDHDGEAVLKDGILSWSLLKPKGIIIFDDYGWNTKQFPNFKGQHPSHGIDEFYKKFKNKLNTLHSGYQKIFEKQDQ